MRTLFDNPAKTLARTNDPETSLIAAEKMVKSRKIGFHERVILLELAAYAYYYKNGMTFREIAENSGLTEPQVWRRMSKLEEKNKVERCGVKDGMTLWRIK